MTTVIQSDALDLQKFGEKELEKIKQELIQREKNYQTQENKEEKQLKIKYSNFLTLKDHGKGAFGSVTEYYDLYRRSKYAKKQFKDIQDMKIELDSYDRIEKIFQKKELEKIMATLVKTDIEQNSIFYESGLITLNEFVEKRMNVKLFWWDYENELNYIICRLHQLIMLFYNKNIYHSDLKLVNTIICQTDRMKYYLKLIDVGGATFDYNYLIAITNQQFPPMDQFESTKSKEKRILAELYQMGRMIQEICLSSIYAKYEKLYRVSGQYSTYKEFKNHFFSNSKEAIKESLSLIQDHYSDNIYQAIYLCLSLTSNQEEITKSIQNLEKNNFLQDIHRLVNTVAQEKNNKYYSSLFDSVTKQSDDQIVEELQFYLDFSLEQQGKLKAQKILWMKYEKSSDLEIRWEFDKGKTKDNIDFVIALYLGIYNLRLGNTQPNILPLMELHQYNMQWTQENLYKDARKVLEKNFIKQELKEVVFMEQFLNYKYHIYKRQDIKQDDRKNMQKWLLEAYQIDKNKSKFSELLCEFTPVFLTERYPGLDLHVQRSKELEKKVKKFIEDESVSIFQKKSAKELLLQTYLLEFYSVWDIWNFYMYDHLWDYKKEYVATFTLDYTQEQQEEIFKKLKDPQQQKKKLKELDNILDYFFNKILDSIEEFSDVRQAILIQLQLNMVEYRIRAKALSYHIDTKAYSLKDQKWAQKGYDLLLKTLNSILKYEPDKQVYKVTIDLLITFGSNLGKQKEVKELYHLSVQLGMYDISTNQVSSFDRKQLYQFLEQKKEFIRQYFQVWDKQNIKDCNSVLIQMSVGDQLGGDLKHDYTQGVEFKQLYWSSYCLGLRDLVETIFKGCSDIDYYVVEYKQEYGDSKNFKKKILEKLDSFFKNIQQDAQKKLKKFTPTAQHCDLKENGSLVEPLEKNSIQNDIPYSLYQFFMDYAIFLKKEVNEGKIQNYAINKVLYWLRKLREENYKKDKKVQLEIELDKMYYILVLAYTQDEVDKLQDQQIDQLDKFMKGDMFEIELNKQQNAMFKQLKKCYSNLDKQLQLMKQEQMEKQRQKQLRKEEEKQRKKRKQEEEKIKKQKEKEEKQRKLQQEKQEKEQQKQRKFQQEKDEEEEQEKQWQIQKQNEELEKQRRLQQEKEEEEEVQRKQKQVQQYKLIQQQQQQQQLNMKQNQKGQNRKQQQQRDDTTCCVIF